MSFIVLQDGARPGQFLMDRDRDLLERAAAGAADATLLIYEWDVPTLSLGFHQPLEKINLARLQETHTPHVRRPTGGAAVLHSDELTYSVIWPHAQSVACGRTLQEFIGRAIAAALNRIGVRAELEPKGEKSGSLSNRTSCFVRTSRWEVAAGGRKLVGSAQRKLGNALLQHGSILLGPDHLRIVQFLRYETETEREVLRESLSAKSTSVAQELNGFVPKDQLRGTLEDAFQEIFPALASALHSTEELTR